ncbi:MAG: hypothetical protein AB7G62_19310 [Magnetospirillum sp.]
MTGRQSIERQVPAMCPNTIPIRLTLAELCAAALEESSNDLENAMDVNSFVFALTTSHLLWLVLGRLVEDGKLRIKPRTVQVALHLSSSLGQGTSDQMVSDLMNISRAIAVELTCPSNLDAVLKRVNVAYRESGNHRDMLHWIIDILCKRCRFITGSGEY